MKRVKKIASLLLAVVMMLSMCLTVSAAGNTLTVNVIEGLSLTGKTINVYKLFDVTDNGYKVVEENKTAIKESLTPVPATDDTYTLYNALTNLTVDQYKAFEEAFLTKSPVATSVTPTIAADGKSCTIPNLTPGYYLISVPATDTSKEQSLYALVMIDGADKEITLKGKTPSVEKEADVEEAGVEIGQVITYTVKGVVPDLTGLSSYVYVIRDTLTDGLKFADADGKAITTDTVPVTVTIGGTVVNTVEIDGKDTPIVGKFATVNGDTWTDSATPTQSIQIDLSKVLFKTEGTAPDQKTVPAYTEGSPIVVTYKAIVTKEAEVKENNSAYLHYGNDPSTATDSTPSKVDTPTFPLDIRKAAANSDGTAAEENSYLEGAEFELYKAESDGTLAATPTPIKVEKHGSNEDGNYDVLKDQSAEGLTTVKTVAQIGANGYNLHINGLKAGVYYLKETKAPAGYNKLETPIKVEIVNYLVKGTEPSDENNNDKGFYLVKGNDTRDNSKKNTVLTVLNNSGAKLPDTGGMGSIIFTIIAVALVIGVGASYVISRRKPQE